MKKLVKYLLSLRLTTKDDMQEQASYVNSLKSQLASKDGIINFKDESFKSVQKSFDLMQEQYTSACDQLMTARRLNANYLQKIANIEEAYNKLEKQFADYKGKWNRPRDAKGHYLKKDVHTKTKG